MSRGRLLVAVALLCGAVLVGAFWLRSITVDETTSRICAKVDRLEQAIERLLLAGDRDPKEGEYGYTYWAEIAPPAERAHRAVSPDEAIAELRMAACDPDSLPTLKP